MPQTQNQLLMNHAWQDRANKQSQMLKSNQALLDCTFKLLSPSLEGFMHEDLPLVQRTPLQKEIYHETCERIQKMIQIAITQWLYQKGGWSIHEISESRLTDLHPLSYSDTSMTMIVDYYKNQHLVLPKRSDWSSLKNGDILLIHYLFILETSREQYIVYEHTRNPKMSEKSNVILSQVDSRLDPLSILAQLNVTETYYRETPESSEKTALELIFGSASISPYICWIVDEWSWLPRKKITYGTYLNAMHNPLLKMWVNKCIAHERFELLAPMFKLYKHLFEDEQYFHQILVEIDRSELVFSTRQQLRRQLATELNSFHFLEERWTQALNKLPFERSKSDICFIRCCKNYHFAQSIEKKNRLVNMLLGIIE